MKIKIQFIPSESLDSGNKFVAAYLVDIDLSFIPRRGDLFTYIGKDNNFHKGWVECVSITYNNRVAGEEEYSMVVRETASGNVENITN